MFNVFVILLLVLCVPHLDEVTVEPKHFDVAISNCQSHGGLKSLTVTSVFGQEAYMAICVDGTNVQEKTK